MVQHEHIPTISKPRQVRSAAMVYWLEWEAYLDISQPRDDVIHLNILTRESANVFCKEPDSKYFRIVDHEDPCPNYSTCPL